MKVGLAQISKAAGVSKTTVSLVLNGKEKQVGISDARAKEIREIAAEMKYRPHRAARMVAKGQFKTAMLIQGTREYSSNMPAHLLESLCLNFDEHKYHMGITCLEDQVLTDEKVVPQFISEWMCDGLVINYHAGTPLRLINLLKKYSIPAIWLNYKMDHDCVYPDDYGCAQQATRHLLEHGHQRIAYVDGNFERAGSQRHYSKIDRQDGYIREMVNAGQKPVVITDDCGHYHQPFIGHLEECLRGEQAPTAFYCSDVPMGLSVAFAAERQGLQVGRDISIVTTCAIACTTPFQFTTLTHSYREMGALAVKQFFRKLQDPESLVEPILIPYRLEEGHTVAAISR